MSATSRDVGGMVRIANLLGVLGWHAVVGVVCLFRGRSGFEALQSAPIRWGVSIMLAVSVLVIAELVFRRRDEAPVERLGLFLALSFSVAITAGWSWAFWCAHGYGYDRLASAFSRGLGASFDAETGSGFAGTPWLGMVFGAGLGTVAWAVSMLGAEFLPRTLPKGVALAAGGLAALGLGAVLHFSNGTLLGL